MSLAPKNGPKSSIPELYQLRRGTVLEKADFGSLQVWTEEDEAQDREVRDDDNATDDYEFDDSLRYSPLSVKHTLADLWDWVRGRKGYRIEGDKFYVIRKVFERRRSTVEVCEHESGRVYIVKRLALEHCHDIIQAADQFNNLRNYDHPHVLFVYKAGIANAPTWKNWAQTEVRFVLPFTNGHLLSAELEHRRHKEAFMHPKRILRLFREILDGVFEIHSHSNGDAHRDLRPGSIMIRDPDDWPVIVDLDACTPAVIETNDEDEVRHFIDICENVTSPFYRAPETFDITTESVVDERTDIWAMGCTLYAMCFFHSPFQPHGVGELPPKDFRLHSTELSIKDLTTESFLFHYIPKDSPYPPVMHDYMARLLSVELGNRPTTEQAIRELDEMIAMIGGPDQPICVKYPWINPAADEMAADVLQKRLVEAVALDFDRMYPDASLYNYKSSKQDDLRQHREEMSKLPHFARLKIKLGIPSTTVHPNKVDPAAAKHGKRTMSNNRADMYVQIFGPNGAVAKRAEMGHRMPRRHFTLNTIVENETEAGTSSTRRMDGSNDGQIRGPNIAEREVFMPVNQPVEPPLWKAGPR